MRALCLYVVEQSMLYIIVSVHGPLWSLIGYCGTRYPHGVTAVGYSSSFVVPFMVIMCASILCSANSLSQM